MTYLSHILLIYFIERNSKLFQSNPLTLYTPKTKPKWNCWTVKENLFASVSRVLTHFIICFNTLQSVLGIP